MDFGSRVSLMVSLSLFSLSLSLSLSNALSLFKNKFRYVNTSEHTSHHINFAQQQQKTLISNSVSNNHTAQRRRQEAKRRTRTELEVEKGDESSYSSGLEWPYGSMRARRWAQAAFAKPFYGGRKDAKETTERGSTSQRKGSQTENSKKKTLSRHALSKDEKIRRRKRRTLSSASRALGDMGTSSGLPWCCERVAKAPGLEKFMVPPGMHP